MVKLPAYLAWPLVFSTAVLAQQQEAPQQRVIAIPSMRAKQGAQPLPQRKSSYSLTLPSTTWLDTGVTVAAGERLKLSAKGSFQLADGRKAGPAGVDRGWRDLLAFRYGHAARRVLAVAAERPELARPILPGHPDLLAEAAIAARLEQARSVADVLLRRTRLGLVAAPQLRTADSVAPVAEAMAGELGWDARRVRQEAEAWPEAASAEGIDAARA